MLCHATTKAPLASIATAGNLWMSGVNVLTRNSAPWRTPAASKRCA
jgi:hypothetical protein